MAMLWQDFSIRNTQKKKSLTRKKGGSKSKPERPTFPPLSRDDLVSLSIIMILALPRQKEGKQSLFIEHLAGGRCSESGETLPEVRSEFVSTAEALGGPMCPEGFYVFISHAHNPFLPRKY